MCEHSFYFKLAYTNKTICYNISPDKLLTDFINFVKTRVRDDFTIGNNFDIEIVPTSQKLLEGQDAEAAAKLELSNYYTIRDIYGENYKNISFYIRTVSNYNY